ncbi:FACR1 reductase, partial [Pseudoatta argentina]
IFCLVGGIGFLGNMLIEKLLRSCPDISMIYVMIVNIIFHIATNMQFYENLKISTIVNIDATAAIIKLAKHMRDLMSFIHVSTIYSNCHVKHIEERLYSYPINHKHLSTFARNLPENIFEEKISNRISSQWPNTYTFTKAISEGLFKNENGDLPIGIFRPAMVISSVSEPLIGWIDNMYVPSIFARSLLDVVKFHHCNGIYKANIVPVDFTVNALIASAWDVYYQYKYDQITYDMTVYNFVPQVDGPTWNEYINALLDINKMYPLHNALYLPLMTLFKHEITYRFCVATSIAS